MRNMPMSPNKAWHCLMFAMSRLHIKLQQEANNILCKRLIFEIAFDHLLYTWKCKCLYKWFHSQHQSQHSKGKLNSIQSSQLFTIFISCMYLKYLKLTTNFCMYHLTAFNKLWEEKFVLSAFVFMLFMFAVLSSTGTGSGLVAGCLAVSSVMMFLVRSFVPFGVPHMHIVTLTVRRGVATGLHCPFPVFFRMSVAVAFARSCLPRI